MRTALRWTEHVLAVIGPLALLGEGVDYVSKRAAVVATVRVPENMARSTAMLTVRDLGYAPDAVRTMAKVVWQTATANPDATAVCMTVMLSKDGAVDKYGHPLTENRRLAVVIERNAEEIRKYKDGEVYAQADNSKVFSRYIEIIQKAREKPDEVADCPR